MKNLLLSLTLFTFLACPPANLMGQTVKTVGGSGDYATLQAAFQDVQNGTLTGDIVMHIISDITETGSSVIVRDGSFSANYSSITVMPSGGHHTISYGATSPLVYIDGSTNITFDGRIGGAGDQISLTLENSSGNIFSISNNASDITIRYCNLKGNGSNQDDGVIRFTVAGDYGCSNVLIDYCNIGDESYTPANGIYVYHDTGYSGEDGKASDITISNSNIFNFWNPGGPSAGIKGNVRVSGWTVAGNNFYQTAARTSTASGMHYGIYLGEGDGHIIEDNYIGGSEPDCGGTPWTISGDYANKFTGIHINSGTITPASVQGNTIANFSHLYHSTTNAVSLPGIWTGIHLAGGDALIGTETGNTIGSGTGTGSIIINSTDMASVTTYGIGLSTSGNAEVTNNTVGSFTLDHSYPDQGHNFTGIEIVSGNEVIVEENLIGSEDTENSIYVEHYNTNTTNEQISRGISSASTGNVTIKGNTVSGMMNNGYWLGRVAGIDCTGGTYLIEGNVVKNLASMGARYGTEFGYPANSIKGIAVTGTSGDQQIIRNTIHTLEGKLEDLNDEIWATGIFFMENSGVEHTIAQNIIFGIDLLSEDGRSLGVFLKNSNVELKNNAIRLGHGISNNQTSAGILSDGDNFILGNSVYITGTIESSDYKSYAYFKYPGTDTVMNNIFYNARRGPEDREEVHVSIGRWNYSNAVLVSDYNNLYADGREGIANLSDAPFGTGYAFPMSFENWQAGEEQDENSLSVDPLFAGADEVVPDLHITEGSPMRDAGTAVDRLITDFDADLRGQVPDIGSDEFFTSSGYVGNGGYNTLKEVFDAINAGDLTGDISVVLNEGTTETETAVLYPSGYDGGGGTSDYSSVTIGSSDQSVTVSGHFAGPLAKLDGAHDVTLVNLTFENTHSSGYCIEFTGSAVNNRVAHSILNSAIQETGKGVITFGGAGSGAGNNNNLIEYCMITGPNGSYPSAGIVSAGTSGNENSNNTVSNNKIFNFWSDDRSSAGISIDANNTDWIISDNHFYQEDEITAGGGNTHYGIYLASSVGHTLTGNFIGGSAMECGGTPWTTTGSFPNIFAGIYLDGVNDGEITVQNNTIGNFHWETAPDPVPGEASVGWAGIRFAGGITGILDNTIGSGTGNGNIVIHISSEVHAVSYGIVGGIEDANITISGNTIGGIEVSSGNTSYSHSFAAILNDQGTEIEISGNLIGSTETTASIIASTECASTDLGQYIVGIVSDPNATVCIIDGNTISNLINLTKGSAELDQPHKIGGIVVLNGKNQITGNIIRDLYTSAEITTTDWSESATGIINLSPEPDQTISGNTIYNIGNSSSATGVQVSGINYTGPASGTNMVNANRIYGLSVSSSGGSGIRGINIQGGVADYVNNMISLGNGVTEGAEIYGIYKNTGETGNFYFNSVAVSGIVSGDTDINTSSFMHDQTATNDVVKNNIFVNTRVTTGGSGKNYAFYKSHTGDITLDYNSYWTDGTGTVLGYNGTEDRTVLPIIADNDENSINEEVTFTDVATADLHTDVVALNAAAEPVDGIDTDFDGDTRNPDFPDIGADEFTLPVITVDPAVLADFPDTFVRETSDPKSYELSAIDLQADLEVTAPSNFEISLSSEEGFGKSLSISPVNTNVETTTVYVRFAPVDMGVITEEVENKSTGAITKLVSVRGEAIAVEPMVSTSPASDITPVSTTGNGTILQTGGINANNRGFIWWSYTGDDKEIGDEGVTNLYEEGSFEAADFDLEITGLDINTRYNYRAHASNTEGVGYGETVDFWTLAEVPGKPQSDNVTGTTVEITPGTDPNPDNTEYAIREITTNRYVQDDGTMNTAAVWQTMADWGTVIVTLYDPQNRTGNREYEFQVKARNGDQVETDYSDREIILTLANTPNVMWLGNETQTTVDISVYTSSGDYSNNSAATLYAVTDHNSGLFVQSDGTLGSEAAWKTRDDWYNFTVTGLDLGTEYSFSSIARNDDGIETDPGPEVSTYTLAAVPGAPVISNITETTADIEVDPGENPANVELAIMADRSDYYDNYYVQADGSLGSSAIWKTAADWEGLVVQGMTPNEIISFSVKARNGNNVETVYGEDREITTLAATPNPPNVEVFSYTDRLYFTVDDSGNSGSTQFVVQDEISGEYVQADGYLGNDPVWNTRDGWTSATQYIRGLTPATLYSIRTKARNADNIETDWGLPADRVTMALVPGEPLLSDPTSESVDVEIDPDDNPASVTFAIQEQNSSKYVQADGSLGDAEAWRSVADWGVVTVTGLDPDQELALRVKARNAEDAETSFSETSTIRTLAKIPVAPSVEVISSSTIRITIQDDDNPVSVRYAIYETTTDRYVGYNGEFSDDPVWWDPQWYTSFELRYLSPDTEYTFRVIARNSDGVETEQGPAASGTTLSGPPAAPLLAEPADNSTGLDLPVTLSWNEVEQADSYEVEISNSYWSWTADDVVFEASELTGTSVEVEELNFNYTYYWRVNAVNDQGAGEWSEVWSFTTREGPPATPELLSPADGEENIIVPLHLHWSDAHGAEGYIVQVSEQDDFSSLVAGDTLGNTVWYELSGLEGLTTYYWRVKAYNTYGESAWSNLCSFITEAGGPESPVMISPADNAENQPATIELSWEAVSGAVSYCIQIAFDEAMTDTYVDLCNITDNTLIVENLGENTTYFWRVQAVNETGKQGEWSEVWSFTTASGTLAAPVLINPPGNAENQPVSLTFQWEVLGNADTYRFELSEAPDFETLVRDQSVNTNSYTVSDLANSTTYYWRVAGENSVGTGPWSEVWSFTTEATVGIITPGFEEYNIYPNPVIHSICITGIEVFPVRVSVTTRNGVVLINTEISHNQLDVSRLAPGIYLLKVETEKGMLIGKFIKQ